MEIDIIKEARNVFDIEIAELEKLKSKLGDTFQKLVQMILELKNNNKVIMLRFLFFLFNFPKSTII